MSQSKVKAAMRGRGYLLPETIQSDTGLPFTDVTTALVMLQLAGEAEEYGGRWKLTDSATGGSTTPPGAPKATKRAKARSSAGKSARVRSPGTATGDSHRGQQPKTVKTVKHGKNWTAKRGQGRTSKARPYPVQVCSTRWKDPETGQFASRPKDAPKPGQARKGRAGAAVTIVRKDADGEVQGVKTVLGAFRRGQERGQVSKKAVREAEQEMARERLAELNPAKRAELEREEWHEAHRSAKAKKAAHTRKNKPKVKTDVNALRVKVLRKEELVKDAQRRHRVARTYKGKDKAAAMLKARQSRLNKLRAELSRVSQ